jgi:CRP-like cAMP-binding protein
MALALRLANSLENHPFVVRLCRHARVSEADTAAIRQAIQREAIVKSKRELVIEGYENRTLSIVSRGFAVRYKLLHNGKRQILRIVLPGDMIGLPSSFFERASYSVTSVTNMEVQCVSLRRLVALCHRRPNIAIAMLWLAAEEMASYADHVTEIGRRTPLERTAHFLLEFHARLRLVGCATEKRFEIPFSQEIIGDMLGLSAPHVNRMLRQLSTERLISIQRRFVTIEDPGGLQLLGQFQPNIVVPVPVAAGDCGATEP